MYELQREQDSLKKSYSGTPTALQQVIEQVGIDAVIKSMGDIAMGFCDVHGHYTYDMAVDKGPSCKLCPPNPANGTSATQVELYIDMDPQQALGTNPQQKIATTEENSRGEHKVIMPTVPNHP